MKSTLCPILKWVAESTFPLTKIFLLHNAIDTNDRILPMNGD